MHPWKRYAKIQRARLHAAWRMAERKEETQAGQCYEHAKEAFREGAAVAFGLMGMAEAIACNPAVQACPDCCKYASGSVTGMPRHPKVAPDRILAPYETVCIACYDIRKARHERAHPYR